MTDDAEMKDYFVWVDEYSAIRMRSTSAAAAAEAYAEYITSLGNGMGGPVSTENVIGVREAGADNVSLFSVASDGRCRHVATPARSRNEGVIKFPECANYRGELQAKEKHGRFYWRVYCDVDEVVWTEIPAELWAALKKHHDDTDTQRSG